MTRRNRCILRIECPAFPRWAGFTVIELLVVIVILASLLALMAPAVASIRKRSNTAKCASNLRQLHTGVMAFATENNGWLPISTDIGNSFFREVGAALGLQAAFPKNAPDYDVFLCPERPLNVLKKLVEDGKGASYNYGSYGQNEWVCGIPPNGRPRKKITQFTRPSSIWVIADGNAFGAIYWPIDVPPFTGRGAFDHNGKIQAVMLDGHVELFTVEAFATNQENIFGIPTKLPAP
jgi:prepilin-type N-terminal cleavage/methylation domain-containing protein/prepilin-type processing-associated H-X9-DG protein